MVTHDAFVRSDAGFHRMLDTVSISFVATGTAACHTVAISAEGQAYSWGRNRHGQLGLGDMTSRMQPHPITIPANHPVAQAACGRRHTILMTRSGALYGCGSNSEYQLGVAHDSQGLESITISKGMIERVAKSTLRIGTWGGEVTRVACGAEFSVGVNVNGQLAVWGKPEYGQLGNGTNGEFIAKGKKIDYHYVERPQVRALKSASGCEQVWKL